MKLHVHIDDRELVLSTLQRREKMSEVVFEKHRTVFP